MRTRGELVAMASHATVALNAKAVRTRCRSRDRIPSELNARSTLTAAVRKFQSELFKLTAKRDDRVPNDIEFSELTSRLGGEVGEKKRRHTSNCHYVTCCAYVTRAARTDSMDDSHFPRLTSAHCVSASATKFGSSSAYLSI